MVTEQKNPKTSNIDNLPFSKSLPLLYSIENDVFSSFHNVHKNQIFIFVNLLISFLNKKHSKIVLFGSGTSGRFAHLIANEYNKIIPSNKILGLISGGPSAFIKSKEGSEDAVLENISYLKSEIKNTKHILYLGISCSGTASGVLGCLNFLNTQKHKKNIKTGLFFLNPIVSIPKSKILNHYNISVRKIIQEADFKINLSVGSEPISGSTRLKGGSVTQMILDISFYIAAVKLGYLKDIYHSSVEDMISLLIATYSENYSLLKKNILDLKPVIFSTSNSLKHNSSIYYISDKKLSSLSLIDASECPPTFGVSFKTVRGLIVSGGYNSVFTKSQIRSIGNDFIKTHQLSIKPSLFKKHDTLIFLIYKKPSKKMLSLINNPPSKNIFIISLNYPFLQKKNISLSINEKNNFGFVRSALKYFLNAITTQTFIYSGKTYGNLMIDLRLSNNKLIERAIQRIIFPIVNRYKVVSMNEIVFHLNMNASCSLNESFPTDRILSSEIYYKVDFLVPITILTLLGYTYKEAYKITKQRKPLKFFIG